MVGSKFAAVFRSYAKDNALAAETVLRALVSVRKANALMFERVLVVVPTDYDRVDTPTLLTHALNKEEHPLRVEVFPAIGHHSSAVLNQAMLALTGFVPYAAIVSNKAAGYLHASVLERAALLLDGGMKVVGVRISELDDVHECPIENTFAIWNIDALLSVGGFDSDCGVEEIAPLAKLMREFGPCAALISTESTEAKLAVRQSDDGKAHHAEVRSTKRDRQKLEAERMGVTLEWMKGNIIEE